MATAICQNEDCERDDWTLTKPPSEYARGGPTCPDCGTSRVGVEGAEEPAAQTQPSHQGAQAVQQPKQAQAAPSASAGAQQEQPQQQAMQPTQQDQQQAMQPAQQGGGGQLPSSQGAMEMGMQAGSVLAALQSDDPQKKAEAGGRALKGIGMAVAQLGEQREKQMKERNERARQASNEDIQVADQYPTCPECGGQLTGLPESGEFDCPHCSARLEVGR